ncbi:MAG: ABC transporter substrate-binding protein [Trueperaceae bacterium]|nr:ABC transporter substrate-binding protein [Trueperaceae bacterium]
MLKRTLFAIGLVFALSSPALGQTVNVLCSPDLAWCEALGPAFEEATDYDLEFVRLSSSEGLSRLRAEAENPVFDVWFGGTGDPHLVAFHDGLTEFYEPSSWDQLLPELRNAVGRTYIPLYTGPIGFVVNEGVLEEEGAPVPECWEDLRDPAYKGLIGMPDPNSSGTAYTIIATLVQVFGEDEAYDLLGDIHQNVSQYTRSGSAPGQLAGRGDVAMAIQFLHDGAKFAAQGFPLTNIGPCEGTGYEIGGLSLVANAPHPEAARAFIEWALTPEAQKIGAERGESFQLKSHQDTPVPEKFPDLDQLNLIEYDFEKFGDPEVRDRLVERWTNEIFPVPR